MRHSLIPAALTALLCAAPTFAQQPAPMPPAPAASIPAPSVMPQTPTLQSAVPQGITPPLLLPAPPGAKLRFEMDARSEDLLGMVKGFLKGIGETGPPGTAGMGTTAGATRPTPETDPIMAALQDGSLADTLKDVNHVHFMVWEMPPPPAPPTPPLPHVKGGKVLPIPPPPPAAPLLDTNAFYESAFASEGAHRILFTDADEYKLVMVGFPDRKGYAFAVSGGGYVGAARADGYPDMEALTAFLSRVTNAALKTKTGQKVLHDTVETGGTGKGDDKGKEELRGLLTRHTDK